MQEGPRGVSHPTPGKSTSTRETVTGKIFIKIKTNRPCPTRRGSSRGRPPRGSSWPSACWLGDSENRVGEHSGKRARNGMEYPAWRWSLGVAHPASCFQSLGRWAGSHRCWAAGRLGPGTRHFQEKEPDVATRAALNGSSQSLASSHLSRSLVRGAAYPSKPVPSHGPG